MKGLYGPPITGLKKRGNMRSKIIKWHKYFREQEKLGYNLHHTKLELTLEKGYNENLIEKLIRDYKLRAKSLNIATTIFVGFLIISFLLVAFKLPTITGMVTGDQDHPINITVNTVDSIGNLSEYLYGAGIYDTLSQYGKISNDSDCIDESFSNYNKVRSDWENSKMGFLRKDMALEFQANEDGSFNPGIRKTADIIKWAYSNNYKVLLIASYMPSWLADDSFYCSTDLKTCPPKNYTRWGELVVDYLDNVTNDGEYASIIEVEVWNEPDLSGFWFKDVPTTNVNRSFAYNRLYNATYDAIKSKYPDINVGGPAISYIDSPGASVMLDGFLSNFTNKIDFVSYHRYYYGEKKFTWILEDMNNVSRMCQKYGATCPKFYITEWNTDLQPFTDLHKVTMAVHYSDLINNYPGKFASFIYKWDTEYRNQACESFPQYLMYDQFTPSYKTPYNVTKDFATYHSAGSMVFNSTTDDADIRAVASSNGTFFFTVINGKSSAVYAALKIGSTNLTGVTDLETGVNYTFSENIAGVGQIDAYAVKHYMGYSIETEEPIINTPPDTVIPTISSVSNLTTDDTYCDATITDPDNDSLNVSIRWYNNGSFIQTDYNNSYPSETDFTATLPSANTTIGEWLCSIQTYDGKNHSDFANSSIITLLAVEQINDSEINDTEINDSQINDSEINDTEINDTEINDTEINDTENNEDTGENQGSSGGGGGSSEGPPIPAPVIQQPTTNEPQQDIPVQDITGPPIKENTAKNTTSKPNTTYSIQPFTESPQNIQMKEEEKKTNKLFYFLPAVVMLSILILLYRWWNEKKKSLPSHHKKSSYGHY